MKSFFPKTGSELEWDAAHRRLEDYLRALHITDKEQQDRIIPRILECAAIKHAGNPGLCPTALAMEEVRAALDRWLQQILPSRKRGSVMGLNSLFAIDAPERWPAVFLAEEIPPDFQYDLLECQVLAVPDLRVGSMVPQPFAGILGKVGAAFGVPGYEGHNPGTVRVFKSAMTPAA